MLFPVIAKNSNWEILTNNLVTFKWEDGVKNENFNVFVVHLEISFLEVGHRKLI